VHDGPTAEIPVGPHVGGPAVAVPGVLGRPPRRRLRRPLLAGLLLVSLALLAGGAGRLLAGPSEPPGAWGGHENGRIPAADLCPLTGASGHLLRCDAAAAYGQMSAAYRARFGSRLCITDSYRPYEGQVAAAKRKPELAATPGTSNHGWALAVDLCGGANDFGTRQQRWLQANAGKHGWRQPGWAAEGGSRPEPWHWEFGKLS